MNQSPPPRTAPVVLIADDDYDVRNLLRYYLADDDYTFVEAEDGAATLKVFETARPDIILLDILMPLIDGIEVCARIHALPHGKHVPILMITALDDERQIDQAFEAGATDYITKPIRLPILHQRLRHLLRVQQAEADLRASEARLRRIIAISADAIMLLDADRRIRLFNPSAEINFGYRADEALGQSVERLLPDLLGQLDHVAAWEVRQAPGVEEQANLRFETAGCRKDGTEFAAEVTIGAMAVDGERLLAATVRDISARVQMEQALRHEDERIKRLNADLQRRAGELAALHAASRAMVSSLDLQRVLAVVVNEIRNLLKAEGSSVLLRDPATDELVFAATAGNQGAEQLVGVRVPITAGIISWVVRERQAVAVNDAQHDPRFLPSIDTVTGITTRSVVAVPLIYKSSVWGVVEAVNRTEGEFSEQDREILEALARSASIAIENARLYQAEREQFRRLQSSQTQLMHSEKMSALGRLVASLAHEINNPLQSIQTGLSLVIEELGSEFDPHEVRRDLEIVGSTVARISEIMSRMHDLYRPVSLEIRPTDPRAVCKNVCQLTSKELHSRHILVEYRLADVPPVLVNPDQLHQVFLNMVLNAIDAMPDGGQLRVVMKPEAAATEAVGEEGATASPAAVLVQFSDTGSGMSPHVVAHVFEPFFTTKDKGTGLGLSISYEIVRSWGGDITVDSRPAAGTTFTIRLPV